MMDLNREVAEKVMGWEVYSCPYPDILSSETDCLRDHNKIHLFALSKWNPLTDLNQCFEVVKKLKTKHIVLTMDNQLTDKWRVEVNYLGHTAYMQAFKRFQAEGKTPNEAILRAALEALEKHCNKT